MALVTMSKRELDRVEVLARLDEGHLNMPAAAQLLGLSERQVFRLLARFRAEGAAGLASRQRGRPSNRRLDPVLRKRALEIIRARYADFGPTLAAEKLAARHEIAVSRETLRQWMIADGLWQARPERKRRLHPPRHRRAHCGELIQIDGSTHAWFEERGPACTLLVFIDDATSKLMHLAFVASESTFSYLDATRAYLEAHGKPVAFYSDKHALFRVAKADATGGAGVTQFGRALHELDISIICAHGPQAKGRVERAHKTLQDRLVKELRLAGVSDIAAANAWLPGFIAAHNRRFARPAAKAVDLHRPLAEADDLDDALCWKEVRRVSSQLVVHYNCMRLMLTPSETTLKLAGQLVTVHDHPDGRVSIRHQGVELPYTVFDKRQRVPQGAIVDHERLGDVLAYIRERQLERPPRGSRVGPRRTHQQAGLFKQRSERLAAG